MSKPQAKYLWIDLETAGLDPGRHEILEVAAFATDSDLGIVGNRSINLVTRPSFPPLYLVRRDAADVVQDMHERSGLWADLKATSGDLATARQALHYVIDAYDWTYKDRPVLAGSSVHFDQRFMKRHMSDVLRRCHHRIYDVSTLRLDAEDVVGPELHLPSSDAHRAMPDLRRSLEIARALREAR